MSRAKPKRETFKAIILVNENGLPYARWRGKPLRLSKRIWSKDDRVLVTVGIDGEPKEATLENIVAEGTDSLIATAIERCKKAVEDASDDPIPEGICSNGDQEEGYHDGVCCTLNNIFKRFRAITPASVKAEHARILRERQGKGEERG